MSIPTSDPVSTEITAALNVVGTWNCPVQAHLLTVNNMGTAAAYVTINGPAPTTTGTNEFEVPAGATQEIPVDEPAPPDTPSTYTGPVVQAISSAALSLYVEVAQ